MIKLPHKKAFIFDMDGVIIDNIQYHKQALREFLKAFDLEMDDDYFQKKINGRTMQELVLSLIPDASQERIMELTEKKEALYRDIYQVHLAPTPGLLAFLEQSSSKGIKMAVATSAISANVDFILDGLNIRKYFDFIIDSTMVSKGKPDPEIYANAIKGLGMKPEDCLVFEDALAGIQAGKAAEAAVFGLATSMEPTEFPEGLVGIAKDFQEIDVH